MKKLLIAFLTLLLAAVCCVAVSAEEPAFKVVVSGDNVVSAGSTVEYTVSASDIKIEGGLATVNITFKYDSAFFDASSVEITRPKIDGWIIDEPVKGEGTVALVAYSDMDSDGNLIGITENGKLTYKIKMKVLDTVTDDSGVELYIQEGENDTFGGDVNTDYVYNVECGKLDVKLIKKLASPADPKLDSNGIATYGKVENATSYVLQLYKDGEKLGSAVTASGTEFDFSTTIKKNLGGEYSFTVIAKSSDKAYADSSEARSATANVRGKLSSPSIEIDIDKFSGTVSYKITDPNPDDSVSTYVLKLYDKSGTVKEITSDNTSGTLPDVIAGETYEITVTAIAPQDNPEAGNDNSDESAKVEFTPDKIIGIKISKNPNLSYTEGDTLDLSDMEITVDFAVAKDVKIKRGDFDKYGITLTAVQENGTESSLKHGTDLTLAMDGSKILVTCGELEASENIVIAVKPGQCPHGTTEEQHLDPTCGADGYDKIVCTLCGEDVSVTVLPATGEHEYGEWTWLSKPTTAVDGVRVRVCAKCQGNETQQVTYAEYLIMITPATTLPPETDPPTTESNEAPETDPPATEKRKEDPMGGLGGLGKIFLFVLIGILAVIILFIILAVYFDSRRSRRRRSNQRANQQRNRR